MNARSTTGGANGATSPTPDDTPLYAEHKKVYPAAIKGRVRTVKWTILSVALLLYYLLPFVRWDRGPNAPDQAILVDLTNGRFYFFFIEIWPQEVYYFTGLLFIAAIMLFLMTSIGGRVWCGFFCPQTVWTDLYVAVERFIEGDRRARIKLDKAGWDMKKVWTKVSKHTIWLLIAWWTGGAWVLYFADAPTLVRDLATGDADFSAYLWIGILTATTYTLAGIMREQVCVYMCPWPRIQAALTDEWALNVTYRYDRGEPRGSLKKAKQLAAAGQPAGDCIDCAQCVAVCPTGIDIREGAQLGCINCGLCIDACNSIMRKVNKPEGLIAYDNDINIHRREEGKENIYKTVRARTVVYTALIAVTGLIMLYALATRNFLDLSVLHDRNPLYVQLKDGSIRNGYTIRFLNKHAEARTFVLSAKSKVPMTLKVVGITDSIDGNPVIEVKPDTTREVRALVFTKRGQTLDPTTDVVFTITDKKDGAQATASDFFKAPK